MNPHALFVARSLFLLRGDTRRHCFVEMERNRYTDFKEAQTISSYCVPARVRVLS